MYDNIMPPMEELGYAKQYDFTQYAHDNNINVIPEESFKHLIEETFRIIADVLRKTYGPYGSTVVISDQSETTTTKDGYNVFNAMGFSHTYKRMVYLAIKKIIDRVNDHVGDGTTSCILLAEKMFREIEKTLKTVDDKRNILSVLSHYETMMQNRDHVLNDMEDGIVSPLTGSALYGLIQMAGNYDDELTTVIEKALDPTMIQDEESGIQYVKAVRNVVVKSKLDIDGDSGVSYAIEHLPGDYHVNCNMESDWAIMLDHPTKIRVALYDHAFGTSDWNIFMANYDKETPTLIIARDFNATFLNNDFVRYAKDRRMVKRGIPMCFATIHGDFVRDEIKDLAAVLGCEPINLHARMVDHESLPTPIVQVCDGNTLCFNMDKIPEDYIKTLEFEMETDLSGSMIKHQVYKDRIRALRNEANDATITVKASTSLELKMVSDKLDDCLSIVNSAIEYGIVPNMFVYGYWRLHEYKESLDDNSEMERNVADAIMTSIRGLFSDVWYSKHADQMTQKRDAIMDEIYSNPVQGFDIIKERTIPTSKLPTSAQYDLEVISASISIVKYLLTSRALIFDAHILKPVDDTGSYRPLNG